MLVNWKWENRYPAHHYESSKVVALTTKGNPGRFRGLTVLNPGKKKAGIPDRQEKTPRSKST